MALLETPPNPGQVEPPPLPPAEKVKIQTRKFGELDHSELVHLLDSMDDDRSRSRFRESIYISVIFYLALAWLMVYGPRYIFRVGRVVPSVAEQKERDRLTQLELNKDVAKLTHPKAPPPAPKVDRKMLDQLQKMQQASEAAKAARRLPEAPQQPPPPANPQMAHNQPPIPVQAPPPPVRTAPSPAVLPDSPMPNLPAAPSAPSIATQSAEAAAPKAPRLGGGSGRISGGGSHVGQQTAGQGVEILSDTRGVDFNDYIKRLLRQLKAAWIPLIPEECSPPLNKEGWTMIRFSINQDGSLKLGGMHLEDSTHDRAIDRAAWGSITSVGQFEPLPKAYSGPELELRIQFIISRNPPAAE